MTIYRWISPFWKQNWKQNLLKISPEEHESSRKKLKVSANHLGYLPNIGRKKPDLKATTQNWLRFCDIIVDSLTQYFRVWYWVNLGLIRGEIGNDDAEKKIYNS